LERNHLPANVGRGGGGVPSEGGGKPSPVLDETGVSRGSDYCRTQTTGGRTDEGYVTVSQISFRPIISKAAIEKAIAAKLMYDKGAKKSKGRPFGGVASTSPM